MANLTNPKVIWFKGILFVFLGCLASSLLVFRLPDWSSIALHLIAVWAFCRAYYFAFYVIEKYVDSKFRFAGLLDFARYAMTGKSIDHPSQGRDVIS